MKKALIVATIGGFICAFERNDIKLLKNLGYEVFIACNTKGREEELEQLDCTVVHLPIERNPLKKQNMISYKKLKTLMEKEKFDLVHCHTPVGGVLARLAAKKYRKIGTKVMYTAHGFHFFKGAPLINWLVYYPIEKWLSKYTDILITINHEDYEKAMKKFKAKKVQYVPGIGLNISKFQRSGENVCKVRKSIGIQDSDYVVISVGELTKRKNQETVIRAMAKIKDKDVRYVIVGIGECEEDDRKLVQELGLEEKVIFVGYRKDIGDLLHMADCFVFPSNQEGLPVALMEAMAAGLPIICSDIRGNSDLITDGVEGRLLDTYDVEGYAKAIDEMKNNRELVELFQRNAKKKIQEFSIEKVHNDMKEIYSLV